MTLYLTSNIIGCADQLASALGNVAGRKILAVITAALAEDGYENWLNPCQITPLRAMGFTVEEIDLRNLTAQEWVDQITQTDHIFVSGGNTFALLAAMRQCGFAHQIKPFLNRGGAYIGSSAGAVVLAPDIAYIAPMDDPHHTPLSDTSGLNLIPFHPIPHANSDDWADVGAQIHADTPNGRLINEEDLVIINI